MSLNFSELTPPKSFSPKEPIKAPITGIMTMDMSGVRVGYEFNSLSKLEEAPDFRLRFADQNTAQEINVWLRLPTALLPTSQLSWKIVKQRTIEFLEQLHQEAEKELGTGLGFVYNYHDIGHLVQGHYELLSADELPQDPQEDEVLDRIADLLLLAVKQKIGMDLSLEDEPRDVTLRCYEVAAGRRYHIQAYLGNYLYFEAIPVGNSEETPFRGSVLGRLKIGGVLYKFALCHYVLRDHLPIFYGEVQLRALILEHFNQYAGSFMSSLSEGDFLLEFTELSR
jgi:hypothetical protein